MKDEFDELDKLKDEFDEFDKLNCEFDELDKLNCNIQHEVVWKLYIEKKCCSFKCFSGVYVCISDCLCHFWLDSRYRYIDKSCFEMKILNNLARNCVCLSYLFKHVRLYIPRHPLSSASLE